MIYCPNCKSALADDAKFCNACGAKIAAMVFCHSCGAPMRADAAFCPRCGNKRTILSPEAAPAVAVNPAPAPAPIPKPMPTPALAPNPEPLPTPALAPNPEPIPVLAPTPIPEPTPEPITAPDPEPIPEPIPAPTPEPFPVIPAQPISESVTVSSAKQKKPGKKLSKKAMLFGAIGLALVAAIILLIVLLPGETAPAVTEPPKYNYAVYIKDYQTFFTDLKKSSDPWQITSQLANPDEMNPENLANVGSTVARASADGKYIFFLDKIEKLYSGYDLYYREISDPEGEPVKVDSGVLFYEISSDGKTVTYLKDSDRNLYQYNLTEEIKEKIDGEVMTFFVSDSGDRIFYRTMDDGLYLKNAGQDKEKLASDISNIYSTNIEQSTFYYAKDNILYKHTAGQDRVKLISDFNKIIAVYGSGEIYYTKSGAGNLALANFVTDDLKDADAAMLEPVAPTKPYWFDYETEEEYQAAYEKYLKDYTVYEEAYNEYSAKLNRDSIRSYLTSASLDLDCLSFCYFDGEKETVITSTMENSYYYTFSYGAPVAVYKAYTVSDSAKITLSELNSAEDIQQYVTGKLSAKLQPFIAVKGESTALAQKKGAQNFSINSDGTMVLFFDDIPDGKSYGDLYQVTIKDGKPGAPVLYDSEVHINTCTIFSENIRYFKDYENHAGEMYINKKRVASDVYIGYDIGADGELFFYTDWNDEKELGTLQMYKDGKVTKIADDVHTFVLTPRNQVLYLYDYSLKSYTGELRLWEDGEMRKLDQDVSAIIPYY